MTTATVPAGAATALAERSVESYFRAFGPTPEWDELVWWPPDVFTLASLVLDHAEAYRFVVAPPSGRHWPPLPDWSREVRDAALAWKDGSNPRGCEPPTLVRRCWGAVSRSRDVPLAKVKSGEAWHTTCALLTLHAIADEACAGVASLGRGQSDGSFERSAWERLQAHGSLSRLPPTRVRIVPKTRFSGRGITIRSLSRHLALCYESVEVRCARIEPGRSTERETIDAVLIPWPSAVRAVDFRPAPPNLLENMDLEHFGFFEFAPEPSLDCEVVGSLLDAAVAESGHVDTVVFPEAAIYPEAIADLEDVLDRHGVSFLIAGVCQPATASAFGRNYLHFGVRSRAGWSHFEQDKHHRWCLDEGQIRQYHLTRSLEPKRAWWEAIDIRERTLHVVDVGGGVTTAPLICEDLARLDEVADLVRRIGPSLVVALLLDGPQLATRWPCRYASVIADDPGSAVLTLTSLGMATRCLPPGKRRSRVIAHWTDARGGRREIELAPGAAGVLVTASIEHSTLWTADGRRHESVPALRLAGVRQLRPATAARRARGQACR